MIINQLTDDVISALTENVESAWSWFSEQFYERQATQQADHLLVRMGPRFDLSQMEQACQNYHVYSGGRGQEAVHLVRHLCRALLVKYLYAWSYRQTVRQMGADMLVRSFVGYGLLDRPMSYVTLYHFASWVKKQGHDRLLFSTILQQLDEEFPEEANAAQIGDTYALLANTAPQSRTSLLRDASRRLLNALKFASASAHSAVESGLAVEGLFGAADEVREYGLDKAARNRREEQTAQAAHALLRAVQKAAAPFANQRAVEVLLLHKWLQTLHKILHDEFLFMLDAHGDATAATLREKHAPSAFVLGSTTDTEATFRNHGKKSELGYNVNVAATPRFIREIYAVTGATPDGQGVATLVENQLAHLGMVPPKLIYDRAAGFPKYFAAVDRVSQGQTQLVAALVKSGRHPDRFGPSDFTLDEVGQLICPAGQLSTKSYRSQSADGWNFRFYATQCRGCPLLQKCRGADTQPTGHRMVFINDYAYHQREAIAYTKTDPFKVDMKLRAHIERIIAGLTRYNDARHAHGAGTRNADFQARMCAIAYNLKRWHTLILDQERQSRQRFKQKSQENHDPPET